MAARATIGEVRAVAAVVNRGLRSGLRVEVQGRYGYQGLDLYDADGCIRTLTTGSKSEVLRYLRGMAEALYIVGR